MASASSIDPDIAQAFSGAQSSASSSSIDPEIAAAYASSQSAPTPPMDFNHAGLGAFDTATSAILSFPHAFAKSAVRLGTAALGYDPNTPSWASRAADKIPTPTPTPEETALKQKIANSSFVQDLEGAGRYVGHALGITPGEVQAAGDIATVAAPFSIPGKAAAPEATTAEQVLARQAAASKTNMGAAAAAPNIANVSPELRQAIVQAAQKTGGAVPPDVLTRHIEADSLPVKVQLTEGQATQDPNILSNEVNARAKNPAYVQRYNDQNAQLGQNIQALRDQIGPDVFSTNQVEHGDTLIQAYKAKDAAAQADINQKYQALRDANGGQFPVDAGALLRNATADLHQKLLFDHAPSAVMSTLGRLAENNNMTFENFEALRTNLARIQRSSSDGNEVAAAGVIRNAMENLPLQPGAADLKPLADSARSAAKAQFNAIEADPAYKAAVNDKVPPDRFTSRFVINGNRDDLATMKQNLAGNDAAQQTMGVAALDHLRDQARIDPQGNGNFAAAGFNKGLQALSPKADSLFDPKTTEQLSTLGNVARYVKGQPAGSYVNNSNTFTALAGEHAKTALEGAVNVAAKGVPVGTWIRKAAQGRAEAKATQQSLAPGAGLTRLSDIAKP